MFSRVGTVVSILGSFCGPVSIFELMVVAKFSSGMGGGVEGMIAVCYRLMEFYSESRIFTF